MRKKKAEEHENHERWLVSYADFITLLFAFFVVMYSISSVNEGKYRVLSNALVSAFRSSASSLQPVSFGAPRQAQGQNEQLIPDPHVRLMPELRPLPAYRSISLSQAGKKNDQTRDTSRAFAQGGPGELKTGDTDPLARVMEKLREALSDLIEMDLVALRRTEHWVELEIRNSVLFESGSAVISEEAKGPMLAIAEILKEIPNRVQVEGFTDDVPIATAQFPSNWELSAGRAASMVHLLMRSGVRPERMSAIGYGEYRPVADNRTPEGRARNRRVLLVVMGEPQGRATVEVSDGALQIPPPPPAEPRR